jgi:hypothetical protein
MKRFTMTLFVIGLLSVALLVPTTAKGASFGIQSFYKSGSTCSKARADLRLSQSAYRKEINKVRRSKNLIRTIIFAHTRYQQEVESFLKDVIDQQKKVTRLEDNPQSKPQYISRQKRKLARMSVRLKQMDEKLLVFGEQLTIAQNQLTKYVEQAEQLKKSQRVLRLRVIKNCR